MDEPIQGQERILGVIRIPKEFFLAMTKEQHRLLDSMVENTALAMDRLFATEQYLRSTEEANQERFRSNLLQAISHDLRTPLSGILGTAEILMDMTSHNPACYSLAEGIHKEADWLHALVENILSLTRIQNKPLSLHKQLEAAEEIVGSAVSHIQRRYPSQNITVTVPDSCLLVPMDAKLIAQVLMNLLDNAVKHSQLDGEIHLSVAKSADHNWAIFSVTDEGEGIAASDLPYIFQIFYTTSAKHMDASHGMGLGLPICQAIVKAHGGEMHIHNREHAAGVEVTFQLPLKEEISNEPTSGKNSNCRG